MKRSWGGKWNGNADNWRGSREEALILDLKRMGNAEASTAAGRVVVSTKEAQGQAHQHIQSASVITWIHWVVEAKETVGNPEEAIWGTRSWSVDKGGGARARRIRRLAGFAVVQRRQCGMAGVDTNVARRIAQMGVDSPLRKRGEVRTQRWMWAGREEASPGSLNASSGGGSVTGDGDGARRGRRQGESLLGRGPRRLRRRMWVLRDVVELWVDRASKIKSIARKRGEWDKGRGHAATIVEASSGSRVVRADVEEVAGMRRQRGVWVHGEKENGPDTTKPSASVPKTILTSATRCSCGADGARIEVDRRASSRRTCGAAQANEARAPETWIMSANRIDADARPPSIDVLAPRVRLVRTPRRVGVRGAHRPSETASPVARGAVDEHARQGCRDVGVKVGGESYRACCGHSVPGGSLRGSLANTVDTVGGPPLDGVVFSIYDLNRRPGGWVPSRHRGVQVLNRRGGQAAGHQCGDEGRGVREGEPGAGNVAVSWGGVKSQRDAAVEGDEMAPRGVRMVGSSIGHRGREGGPPRKAIVHGEATKAASAMQNGRRSYWAPIVVARVWAKNAAGDGERRRRVLVLILRPGKMKTTVGPSSESSCTPSSSKSPTSFSSLARALRSGSDASDSACQMANARRMWAATGEVEWAKESRHAWGQNGGGVYGGAGGAQRRVERVGRLTRRDALVLDGIPPDAWQTYARREKFKLGSAHHVGTTNTQCHVIHLFLGRSVPWYQGVIQTSYPPL
ncbi:hypothetical protein B0H14DRAFT_3167784, partial [Mycena olivaceomarginata]